MQSKSKKNEIKKIIKKSLKQKETFLPNKQKVIIFPKNKMRKAKEFFTLKIQQNAKKKKNAKINLKLNGFLKFSLLSC